jgi:hypothetical protein
MLSLATRQKGDNSTCNINQPPFLHTIKFVKLENENLGIKSIGKRIKVKTLNQYYFCRALMSLLSSLLSAH